LYTLEYLTIKPPIFHYSVGLDKIYNTEELDKERQQPYFRREFELAYSVGTGNVFTEQSIQAAEELGRRYKARTSLEGTQKKSRNRSRIRI
jgi:hypothetical protein